MVMEVWLPNALRCGCSYDLFWHLNPKKLEPFFKAKREEQDNEYNKICIASHQTGLYVRLAVASCFNKNAEYPKTPFGMDDIQQDSDGQTMTDADRFAAFVAAHNAQRKRKKEQSETGG